MPPSINILSTRQETIKQGNAHHQDEEDTVLLLQGIVTCTVSHPKFDTEGTKDCVEGGGGTNGEVSGAKYGTREVACETPKHQKDAVLRTTQEIL